MSETVNTYMLDNPEVSTPMNRNEFYAEQVAEYKKGGKPTRAVEVVNVIVFNSHGEMIIQKRSFEKTHNAGLLDKSVGGHLQFGDTPDYTVMVETLQELQTPSIVLKDTVDFQKTHILLNNYLETIAIVKKAKPTLYSPIKIINGEEVRIANKMHLYLGVYDGRIRPVDREAKGILFYTLAELENEMAKSPETFNDDLCCILEEYRDEIASFTQIIEKS